MTADEAGAVVGFETAETFNCKVQFSDFVRRLIPNVPGVGGAVADAAVTSAQRPKAALVGAGTFTVSPDATAMFKAQVKQNFQARPSDPQSGQPLCAIQLSTFDEDWRHGRIGEWIRAYRPDLLA